LRSSTSEAQSEHGDVVAGDPVGPPVGHHHGAHVGGGVGGDDAPVAFVRVEGHVDVTGAELAERVAFPLLALAAVVDQLDRRQPGGESGEHTAGVDLGQLTRVADQHDLRTRPGSGVEDRGESTGAGHAGFVDHQDGPVIETDPAGVELDLQHRERRRRDGGGGLEFGGSPTGEGGAEHPVAVGLPGIASGIEAEGLAGAGSRGDHLNPGSLAQ
jgi:hypothetical protein